LHKDFVSSSNDIANLDSFRMLTNLLNARKCIIDSVGEWHSIHISDSFVPRYKDGKNPQDPDARIFTLLGYYPKATSEEKGKGAEAVNSISSML
jgi:hypothetical protein